LKFVAFSVIPSKYKYVRKSAQPRDPPGCPDFTADTILTISLLTCDAIDFKSSLFMVLFIG
jgi:hypothetical protein